jgi:sec-independent protein translocase protein TatB
MFDIGFWELVLIGLVSLVVFGPERLPGLVRDLSGGARKVRSMMTTARSEIERELELHEMRQVFENRRRAFEREVRESGQDPLDRLPGEPAADRSMPSEKLGDHDQT